MIEKIFIQNLKCDGCAGTIVRTLKAIPEVKKVEVDLATAAVQIETKGHSISPEMRKKLSNALRHAGYPEVGEANLFAQKAKSYVSCAIGKMTK